MLLFYKAEGARTATETAAQRTRWLGLLEIGGLAVVISVQPPPGLRSF